MPLPWSNTEVKLIVTDYFNMLSAELKGDAYSKAAHRRALLPILNGRSESAIEFKHQNISGVLVELGQLYIKGYLPRFNYQQSLKDEVIKYLQENIIIEKQFKDFTDRVSDQARKPIDFNKFIADAPHSWDTSEPQVSYRKSPIKVNYLEREQRNRDLGQKGEELVISYEKWQLTVLGKENLADKVEWISKEQGDGAGFDILSKNMDGTDKYIEVKTTKLSKETPIFFSKNELDFSVEHSKEFFLYRIFDFEQNTKMFTRNGALNQVCRPVAVSYKGFF